MCSSDLSQVEIAAPGVGVNSTWNNNGYKSISGTSMATPHISGLAALILQANPGMTSAQVEDVINNSAADEGDSGKDTLFGSGIANAKAAVDMVKNQSQESVKSERFEELYK